MFDGTFFSVLSLRYNMDPCSVLLALIADIHLLTVESLHKRPAIPSFGDSFIFVSFDALLNTVLTD